VRRAASAFIKPDITHSPPHLTLLPHPYPHPHPCPHPPLIPAPPTTHQVMEEDAQPLEVPIIAPVKDKKHER